MRKHKTNLEHNRHQGAVEQVDDVAADGAEHGEQLGLCEEQLRANLVAAVGQVEPDGEVLEVAFQGAVLVCEIDDLRLDQDLLIDSSSAKVFIAAAGVRATTQGC